MGTVLAVAGTLALGVAVPAGAATTVNAPTIAVSYTPSEIGVGGSTTVAYTITNPNSSGSLDNIGFSDTLGANARIDDPDNVTTSGCGSGATVNAGPGWASTSSSGITVKAGTPCVVEISLDATVAGDLSDSLGTLSYSTSTTAAAKTAPSSNATAATLDVLAPPTATIVTPKRHARYRYGQKVIARFSCAAASDANGSTLSGCLGTDDLGNPLSSGDRLDTTAPGTHTLDVQALDTLGDSTDTSVTYTVLPDNLVGVGVRSARAGVNGVLDLSLAVPGAGTLALHETHGGRTLATAQVRVSSARRALATTLTPSTAGAALIATAGHGLRASLTVTFTPRGGAAGRLTRVVTLR